MWKWIFEMPSVPQRPFLKMPSAFEFLTSTFPERPRTTDAAISEVNSLWDDPFQLGPSLSAKKKTPFCRLCIETHASPSRPHTSWKRKGQGGKVTQGAQCLSGKKWVFWFWLSSQSHLGWESIKPNLRQILSTPTIVSPPTRTKLP